MKRYALLLLLIPSLAFGEVMIYFVASPTVVANRLQNLRARPDLGAGVKEDILDSAIIVATDPDINKVAYATLIPDNLLAAARGKPQFRGKGLQEVKDNYPLVYSKIAQQRVRLLDNTVIMMDMADTPPAGSTVLETDMPLHTFYGYDPWTGEPN
jgi:hypothetical protein